MIRNEVSDALPKLFVRNLKNNNEEELIFCDEKVYSPGATEMQKDRNTDNIYINFSESTSYFFQMIHKIRSICKWK